MQECIYEMKKLINLLEKEEEHIRYVFGGELYEEYVKILKKEKKYIEDMKKKLI